MRRVLAVDDDAQWISRLVRELQADHDIVGCIDGAEALRELEGGGFDAVVADLGMPPPDGFDVLRATQQLSPAPRVVVVSGMDSTRTTLAALRLGARDYLLKPVEPAEVRAVLRRVLGAEETDPTPTAGLVGRSAAMSRVRRLLRLLAPSDGAVLILGETGCGKELFARGLHTFSLRSAAPFVAHNMAATPPELVESLFFGHVRGAFSGASGDHAGLFEQADSGTLFLDEVDSAPGGLQAKLLRVLESGHVQRIGAGCERRVDVRIIAASAVDLAERVEQGSFRADLYYRLRQLEVTIPPLRERAEDIPDLVDHFLDELGAETGNRPSLAPATWEALAAHTWPGNCRELRHALRSAALLASGGAIMPADLPRHVLQAACHPASGARRLADVEREHILGVLDEAHGNRSLAARLLGIDRGTLARKLDRLLPRG